MGEANGCPLRMESPRILGLSIPEASLILVWKLGECLERSATDSVYRLALTPIARHNSDIGGLRSRCVLKHESLLSLLCFQLIYQSLNHWVCMEECLIFLNSSIIFISVMSFHNISQQRVQNTYSSTKTDYVSPYSTLLHDK